MPPWPADPEYRHFLNEYCLSKEEEKTLVDWLKSSCYDTTLSSGQENIKSLNVAPDFTVKMRETIQLPGDGKDRFFLVKIPFEMEEDRIIKAVEFVPGNRKAVHHVNGHLVNTNEDCNTYINSGPTYILSDTSAENGSIKTFGLQCKDGTYPMLTQSFVNYLPGVMPAILPDGIGGFHVEQKGVVLLRDIHYGPVYKDTSDQSTIRFYYSKTDSVRTTREIQMGTLGITDINPPLVIPANAEGRFTTEYTVPIELSLLTINPHMHRLGKSFLAYVKRSKDTIPLIRIPKWDFNWQFFYTFDKPLKLLPGDRIIVEASYDNTINNPNNPNHPPKEVSEQYGSMRSSDEMLQFILTVMPYKEGDENIDLSKQFHVEHKTK